MREGGSCGRGVFATGNIAKSEWLCEYKGITYPRREMEKYVHEYDKNDEGCYIVTSSYPVGAKTRLCWDATRYCHQYGRYLNHAQKPNATLTSPVYVRDKWRIGFVAASDINVGDEVVWDYGIRGGENWTGSRLVEGVVVEPKEV